MTDDIRSLFFSPNEASTYFVQYAEKLKDQPGIKWGVRSLDDKVLPMHPGDVVGVIARPGHGKSSLAAYLARHTAEQLIDEGRSGECVVYVSFEQAIEEIEAMFQSSEDASVTDIAWGRADMEIVKRNAVRRIKLPVWFMGRSMERRKKIPRMTVDNIYRGLAAMEDDYKIKPALVVFDYIQLVPLDKNMDRTQQVSEAIVRSKELASYLGCPIVVCVQASREVDKFKIKIPGAADCQWASAIEQTADKLFGLWRPYLTEEKDKPLFLGEQQIPITPELLIMQLLKQRMAPAGNRFALHFAPQYIRLADMELRNIDV